MPILNLTRQTTIAQHVETADNPLKRMQGLLGRSSLERGHALVIPGCNSIHMFFMKFAIDVIFVDKHNKVTGLVCNIQPFGVSPLFFKSACAIELPAGTIETTKTEHADQLTIQ